MLAQDLHYATIPGQMDVVRFNPLHPDAVGDLEHRIEPVRCRLVRPHDTKISRLCIQRYDLAEELSHYARCFRIDAAGARHVYSVRSEVWQFEFAFQQSTVGVRIGAHTTAADWSERLQFIAQTAVRIEKRFRLITSHPLLKQFQMVWIAAGIGDRNLMRAPETL